MTVQKETGRTGEQAQGWSFVNEYTGNFSNDLRVNEGLLQELAGILKARRSLKIQDGPDNIERIGLVPGGQLSGFNPTRDWKPLGGFYLDPNNPNNTFIIEINSKVIDGRIRDGYGGQRSYKEAFHKALTGIILEGVEAWMQRELVGRLIKPWEFLRISYRARKKWEEYRGGIVSFGSESSGSPDQQR